MRAEQMLKMCLRKKKYRDLKLAKNAAKYATDKYGKLHYVYLCPLCLNYHLTTHKQEGSYYYYDPDKQKGN